MTKRVIHPLLQKLAALVVLAAGVAGLGMLLGLPLAEALGARDAARARLARFEAVLKAPVAAEDHYDPGELTAEREDDGAAQLALQADIGRLAKKAGIVVQSVRPLQPESLGAVGRAVWLEAALSGDLQSLTDLLAGMDAERPILLIRKLDIERGPGARSDTFMVIRMEIGSAWRPNVEGKGGK